MWSNAFSFKNKQTVIGSCFGKRVGVSGGGGGGGVTCVEVWVHDLSYHKHISYSGLGGEESLFAERNVSQVVEAVAELGCNHPSPAPGYFGHSLRPFVKMATTKSPTPHPPPPGRIFGFLIWMCLTLSASVRGVV